MNPVYSGGFLCDWKRWGVDTACLIAGDGQHSRLPYLRPFFSSPIHTYLAQTDKRPLQSVLQLPPQPQKEMCKPPLLCGVGRSKRSASLSMAQHYTVAL